MTAQPASAKRGSSLRGNPESSAAKITFGAPSGFAGDNYHSRNTGGNRCLQTPARGLRIRTAFGPVRSRQPRDFEPWVMLQHLDKALPDDAGGTQNSYRDFRS